jgi:pantothenate kinase type III
MQGLITLDFGNSHPHAGLFQKRDDNWNLVKIVPFNELSISLTQLNMNSDNTSIVVCEVKPREDEIHQLQQQGFLVTRVKDYWRGFKFSGMPVQYSNTLGEDRLIEAYYCYKQFKSPTLIIDSGTFVTLDVINHSGFLGGYIIPGIDAYYEAYSKGERLKDVKLSPSKLSSLPTETSMAMAQSYTAFASLAKSVMNKYHIQKIILTGGSLSIWEDFLEEEKENYILEIDPHLIHRALHYWMITQIELL